jgi:hypothetical protein
MARLPAAPTVLVRAESTVSTPLSRSSSSSSHSSRLLIPRTDLDLDSEENLAVKERKQVARLHKDKLRGIKVVETSMRKAKSSSPLVKREYGLHRGSEKPPSDDGSTSTSSGPVAVVRSDETALSTRRRFNRTIPLHTLARSNHLLLSTQSIAGEPSLSPGLAAATFAFHISSTPQTAPASTTTCLSYFVPQPDIPLEPPTPRPEPATVFAPQPRATFSPSLSPQLPLAPLEPTLLSSAIPLVKPSVASSVSTTEYPLTPPHEPVYLSPPHPIAFAFEHDGSPWYDAAPPPPPPARAPPLHNAYSSPQLVVQHEPTPSWSLYNAIPSPAAETSSYAPIEPPLRSCEATPYFSPYVTPPLYPIHLPATQEDYLPSSSLQHSFAPSTSYDATSSLGLQLMHPTENAPLPLNPASSWTSRYTATTENGNGAAHYAAAPWTESWVEKQGREYVEPRSSSLIW